MNSLLKVLFLASGLLVCASAENICPLPMNVPQFATYLASHRSCSLGGGPTDGRFSISGPLKIFSSATPTTDTPVGADINIAEDFEFSAGVTTVALVFQCDSCAVQSSTAVQYVITFGIIGNFVNPGILLTTYSPPVAASPDMPACQMFSAAIGTLGTGPNPHQVISWFAWTGLKNSYLPGRFSFSTPQGASIDIVFGGFGCPGATNWSQRFFFSQPAPHAY